MAKVCGECRNFEQEKSNGEGKCKKLGKKVYKKDSAYDHDKSGWCFDPKEFQLTGCFITTAVVNMLGMADNCKIMENMRELRGKMKETELGRQLLVKYDLIGPRISKLLLRSQSLELASGIYHNYLVPCGGYVDTKEYGKATYIFDGAINRLLSSFSLDSYIPDSISNSYQENSAKLGHGKVILKEQNKQKR